MSNIPNDLRYAKSHEWVKVEADGSLRVGISDHAQAALGDVVFVEVPEAGRKVKAGEACAVVESVKAASDIYAPVSGEILEGNGVLADAPETVNQDSYGQGWFFRIQPDNAADVSGLLDAAGYAQALKDEGH
jgi:glycine cleavage system H protein